eukprot:TRINITY_DN644_c0_g1_i7.p1 TRINITY_DN644_c0_g1~~TRINITY_DN644_c0_g1_i7.p1  ORF type:complete len:129 (-),score=13.33 TRINITY_DN644_c0_g1_i7:170-556(-)
MTVWSGVRPAPGSCDRCVVGRLPGAGDQDPAGQGDRAAEVWRHSGRCMATNGAARDGDEVCLVWNPPRRMKKKQEDRPWYVVKQDSYPSLREIQKQLEEVRGAHGKKFRDWAWQLPRGEQSRGAASTH